MSTLRTLLSSLLVITAAAAGAQIERLDSVFNAYVDDKRLPGAVILVNRDGQRIHTGVYGFQDMEERIDMSEDTIFRIASQTKAVVSVAVMMLQEEGKLLIDDAVGKYIPEFLSTTVAVAAESGSADSAFDVVPAARPITIRDLLTHTAGIDYGNGPAAERWEDAGIQGWYFAHRDEPIQETIKTLAALPQAAQPGTGFVYGYNTDILGALVEVVSKQPLDEFLTARIFEPLGMSDTHFYLPKDKRDRLAVVYSADANGSLTRTPDVSAMIGQGAYVEGPRASFSGGAGLLSTAGDYLRFLSMLANRGRMEGERILSRKTVELMTVNHLGDVPFTPGSGFGLGFRVVEDLGASGVPGSVGEYGWGGAYHTVYWVDPKEHLVVTYMTQVLPATGLDDHAKLRALIYQALD